MIKYLYPDGSALLSRALHTTRAVYTAEDGRLMARTTRADESELYEFEIIGFELLEPGVVYK